MTDEQKRTLALLDEVIRDLERIMRDASDIGIDRARIALVLVNCRRVRAGLDAAGSGSSSSDRGSGGPETGGRSGGLDCAGPRLPSQDPG